MYYQHEKYDLVISTEWFFFLSTASLKNYVIKEYVCVCVCACVCVCVCVCVCACACVHAWVRACVCTCTRVHADACGSACVKNTNFDWLSLFNTTLSLKRDWDPRGWGKRETIPNTALSPPEWFCITMVNSKSCFNVSLTVDKITLSRNHNF